MSIMSFNTALVFMPKTMQVVGVSLDCQVTPTLMDCIHIALAGVYGATYHKTQILKLRNNPDTISKQSFWQINMLPECEQSS